MTTTEKCEKPATAAARLGSLQEVPLCDEHLYKVRAKSARAGKKDAPAAPKGAKGQELAKHKEAVAAFEATNRDDVLPVQSRGLTQFERDGGMSCYFHIIGADVNAL